MFWTIVIMGVIGTTVNVFASLYFWGKVAACEKLPKKYKACPLSEAGKAKKEERMWRKVYAIASTIFTLVYIGLVFFPDSWLVSQLFSTNLPQVEDLFAVVLLHFVLMLLTAFQSNHTTE